MIHKNGLCVWTYVNILAGYCMTVTFVTALYDIGRLNWKSFGASMDGYIHWLEQTINYTNNNYVIFTDESTHSKIQGVVQKRKEGETTIVVTPLNDLEAYKRYFVKLKSLIESPEFISRRPFDVPEHMHPEYNVIMFSKLFFMKQVTDTYPGTTHVAWIDAGFCRWSPPENPLTWPQVNLLPKNKIVLFTIDSSYNIANRFDHAMSQSRFTQGCCFISPIHMIDTLIDRCDRVIGECFDNHVIGSDEKVLDLCYLDNPDLFEANQCEWRKYFGFYMKREVPSRVKTGRKNLILGVFCKYTLDNIKLWCDSASLIHGADKVLIQLDTNDKDNIRRYCEQRDVRIVYKKIEPGGVHNVRLKVAWEFLQETKHKYDIVCWCDVNDVVFQADPFPLVAQLMETHNKSLVVGSEGLDIQNEPWNGHNIQSCFPHLIQHVVKQEVHNSGVMFGKHDHLKDFLLLLYECCKNITTHDIRDQAALNILISNALIKDHIHIVNSNTPLMIHCAVSCPTELFVSWGFHKAYKYAFPVFQRDKCQLVCPPADYQPFSVVHQYNRMPEWKQPMSLKWNELAEKNLRRTGVCICTTSEMFGRWRENIKSLIHATPNAHLLVDITSAQQTFQQDLVDNETQFTHKLIYEALPCPGEGLPAHGHWWNQHGSRNAIWFYPYLRMLYFYKQHPDYEYYWFFDDDFQCSDAKMFLDSFENSKDDFISYFCFKHRDVPLNVQPNIPHNDDKMASVDWFKGRFPGPGDVLPDEIGTQLFGSFFAATRWSKNALKAMLSAIEKGYHAYGEGSVPTLLHHAGLTLNTILRPDNTSAFFDVRKVNISHKDELITWNWL